MIDIAIHGTFRSGAHVSTAKVCTHKINNVAINNGKGVSSRRRRREGMQLSYILYRGYY